MSSILDPTTIDNLIQYFLMKRLPPNFYSSKNALHGSSVSRTSSATNQKRYKHSLYPAGKNVNRSNNNHCPSETKTTLSFSQTVAVCMADDGILLHDNATFRRILAPLPRLGRIILSHLQKLLVEITRQVTSGGGCDGIELMRTNFAMMGTLFYICFSVLFDFL